MIIFGLKDSQNIDATAGKSEDEAMLTQLLKSLKVGNVKTEKVFRINTKQTDKPKPLIVVLKDKENRRKLLNLAKNLKKEIDYKTVYICPDLTEAQRMNFKRLLPSRKKPIEQGQQRKRNLLWNPWG